MCIFGIFTMTIPKPFAGDFLPLIIFTLHFKSQVSVNIVMLVNRWEFETPSSFAVLSWVVFVWGVFPSCPLRSHLQY